MKKQYLLMVNTDEIFEDDTECHSELSMPTHLTRIHLETEITSKV